MFDKIDKAADKVESALNVAADAAGKAVDAATAAGKVVAPVAERAAQAAKPIGEAGLKYAERTIAPIANDALSKVTAAEQSALSGAGAAIKAKGIDVDPALGAAKTVAGVAAEKAQEAVPVVTGFVDYLQTATPTELAEVAVAAGAIYLAVPVVLGGVAGALRGYAGSIRPVEAYDEVLSGGNIVIVDVRGESEVERGAVEFPRRAAGKVRQVPREKLQGNFKNMGDVEATLTATKVASLKGVKKGTKVLVLDANGRGDAPKVAKALGSQGFGKVFVIEGGFNGWCNAGLGVTA